jgi:hypothetical protein
MAAAAAETIRQHFPALSLEQIHGAIAFYLGHPQETVAYLFELKKKWDELERAANPASDELQQRLEEARRQRTATRSFVSFSNRCNRCEADFHSGDHRLGASRAALLRNRSYSELRS